MGTWTWWMPEKNKIDSIVNKQEDKDFPEKERIRKAKVNKFYKREQARNKYISQLNSNGGKK